MKWLGRWLSEVIRNSELEKECVPRLATKDSDEISGEESLNITVRRAIGGRIVSFRHYDRKVDRTIWRNYVVPDDLDFEHELAKMITLESMRLSQ